MITTNYKTNNQIDCIFLQSQKKELENNRLHSFLKKNIEILESIDIPIYLFLDNGSQDLINKIAEFRSLFKNIVFICDQKYLNPTTYCFRFIINYMVEEYQKVLLLESDCALKKDFINLINKDLNAINSKWYIYGSAYYGESTFLDFEEQSDRDFYRKHMNGVAVYNRSDDFVDFVNESFAYIKADYIKLNYDMALYKVMAELDRVKFNIDSDLILNISSQADSHLSYKLLKPYAAIVHSKSAESINIY